MSLLKESFSGKNWQMIGRHTVFLCAHLVSLPKTISVDRILEIQDIHYKNRFNFKRLGNNQALNDRRNYYITI